MKTNKEKQDQRKAALQAAALRDGFETWSQAFTAWKNGKARLMLVAAAMPPCSHERHETVWHCLDCGEYV